MDFRTQTAAAGGIAKLSSDALVVVLPVDAAPQALEAPLQALIDEAVEAGDLQLKTGRTLYVHRPAGLKVRRVVLATAANAGPKAVRAALAAAAGVLKNGSARQIALLLATETGMAAEHAEAVVGAFSDAGYVYRHTKPSAAPAWEPQRVSLLCAKTEARALDAALVRGSAIAEGVRLARECANRPGNHATPTFLGEQAKELGREHGFKVEVLDRRAVEKLGMGAFLAVAQGSEEPLRFIVMKYDGAGRGQAPVVLVGKGITFDTGGISIKPSAEMDEMKFDMGGAASVLGTFAAIGRLKPRVNVVGVIPACENMPDGRAVKPGDVVTSMSGQTIEILNTDAEGRLVLCDALTYVERFKPAAVIDIATLTGACVIALGNHRTGLFTADDELAQALELSGQAALDPCWRMPLDDEYEEALKSNFADMGNVGGRAGGAITAAMFLRKFTAKYPWAHLDIAGTAWKSGAAKGATGRPVALLTHFVLGRAR